MTAARKPWAVLAYTVADDRSGASALDAAAQRELKALCDGADFTRVSVAAQVDFKRPKGVFRGTLTERPAKSRGFADVRAEDHPLWRRIIGAVDESRTVLRVQREEKDLSAARASVLSEFLRFGHEQIDAERYVVAFYGHAYGPYGLFCDRETGQREVDTLRLNDLAGAFDPARRKAAVLVFRDCFMNTLEAAYQLRSTAEFMLATQALAPVEGVWPWQTFLQALDPEATSLDVGVSLATHLGAFLDDPKNRGAFADVPYALLDLDAAPAIVAPLRNLGTALEAARTDPARRRACARALESARLGSPEDGERPGDPALIDVPTMCEALGRIDGDPVAEVARDLGAVIGTRLVRWEHSQQRRYRGTSLYYKPVRPVDLRKSFLQAEDPDVAAADAAHYKTLALCQATGWDRVALEPLSRA